MIFTRVALQVHIPEVNQEGFRDHDGLSLVVLGVTGGLTRDSLGIVITGPITFKSGAYSILINGTQDNCS
ncbi:MAG: hypothetical protein NTU44_04670 [Bacteroidetes bacterium]|nr:hypothetical protein [Bacteroidota bacterium]